MISHSQIIYHLAVRPYKYEHETCLLRQVDINKSYTRHPLEGWRYYNKLLSQQNNMRLFIIELLILIIDDIILSCIIIDTTHNHITIGLGCMGWQILKLIMGGVHIIGQLRLLYCIVSYSLGVMALNLNCNCSSLFAKAR